MYAVIVARDKGMLIYPVAVCGRCYRCRKWGEVVSTRIVSEEMYVIIRINYVHSNSKRRGDVGQSSFFVQVDKKR